MPLIECPDCKRQVSDAAPTCLGCGRPMEPKVQTIEKTGKSLKGQMVLSTLALIVGVLMLVFSYNVQVQQAEGLRTFGIVVSIGALAWLIIVKANIWWKHG